MTPAQLKSNKCITHWVVGSCALLHRPYRCSVILQSRNNIIVLSLMSQRHLFLFIYSHLHSWVITFVNCINVDEFSGFATLCNNLHYTKSVLNKRRAAKEVCSCLCKNKHFDKSVVCFILLFETALWRSHVSFMQRRKWRSVSWDAVTESYRTNHVGWMAFSKNKQQSKAWKKKI